MSDELEQLLRQIADWPPEVQQKVIDAIRASRPNTSTAMPATTVN
jgi:hypothetical protein